MVVANFVGDGSFEIDRAMMDAVSAEIERRDFASLFVDARGQRRVHAETKEYSSTWFRRHKGQVAVHVLLSSKLIDMAISVMRMLTRTPLRTYSDEDLWLEALRHEAPSFVPPSSEIRAG